MAGHQSFRRRAAIPGLLPAPLSGERPVAQADLDAKHARTWEEGEPGEQPIRREHSPLYNFIYGATTGRRCDVEEATETLQDWPWELIDWATRGSQRTDVQVLTAPGRHRNRTQLNRVLPASERSQGRWNSSPWVAEVAAADGVEHDGVAWSLGYWLGVYHGFLPAKD